MTATGLDMARQNRLITVEEVDFMRPNPAGIPIFRSDVGSDGNGLTNPQNWIEHMADGSGNLVEATALVGEEGRISRTFMPRYELMEQIWRNVAGLPLTDTTIDGGTRRRVVWVDPAYGSPEIVPFTGYYGQADNAVQLTGGKIVSFNIDVRRAADGGTCGGNIEMHFNRYLPEVAVPGAAPANARVYIGAAAPTVDLVLGIAVGAGAAAPVTITPGMTAAQIKTALEGHADITTAVVTGSIASGVVQIEITSPANTKVVFTKTSGVRWTLSQRSYGGNGTGLIEYDGPYLEPDHCRVYLAEDDDELALIDYNDLPDDYGSDGDSRMLKTSNGSTFALTDLWKPHYAQTGKRFATQFVSGARSLAASLIVPNDTSPGSDCRFILDTQNDAMARGFWVVRNFVTNLGFEYKEEVYVGRNSAAGFAVDNDVYQREFPLVRRRNPDSGISARITLTLPV